MLRLESRSLGRAVVVVDEAYVEFAGAPEPRDRGIRAIPNLVVLRTLSKAFGLAGVRSARRSPTPPSSACCRRSSLPTRPAPVLLAALAALSPEGLAAARASVRRLLLPSAHGCCLPSPSCRWSSRVWPSDGATSCSSEDVDFHASSWSATRAVGVVCAIAAITSSNSVRITIGTAEENYPTLEVLSRA